MAESTTDNGNGRVTNAIIMTKLDYISDDIKQLTAQVGKIDNLCTRVDRLEKEQDKLRTKSDGWSILNTIGVFTAGAIGFLTGK